MPRALLLAALFAVATLARADWPEARRNFNAEFASKDPDRRILAVRELRDADHAEGARFLLRHFLSEKDARVRAALADAIADLGSPEAREATRKLVKDEKDGKKRARLCELFSTGRMLDRAELLRDLLADREPAVRVAALGAMGAMDLPLLVAAEKLVADTDSSVRLACLEMLGRLADPACAWPLVGALESADSNVQAKARQALVRLADRDFGADIAAWRRWAAVVRVKDAAAVDKAIALGAEYLRQQVAALLEPRDPQTPRLDVRSYGTREVPIAVYAMLHAGVPHGDPVMKAGLEHILSVPIADTYNASIIALALADLDAARYATRLAEIGQWLADAQCENGQWSYSGPGRAVSPNFEPGETETGPGGKSRRKIRIAWSEAKRRPGGDNSNTQFAILGLRAAMEAGCEFPKAMWERSLDWFQKAGDPYGGWGYVQESNAYWAMTCCGIVSYAICLRALGKDEALKAGKPAEVARIGAGLTWLSAHWTPRPTRGRGGHGWGTYYDLYSIERVGMILGLQKIGDRDWYEEGKEGLLASQERSGSWGDNAVDTAFAILFLKKATRGYTVSPPEDK
jgi:HEAT repeat protein